MRWKFPASCASAFPRGIDSISLIPNQAAALYPAILVAIEDLEPAFREISNSRHSTAIFSPSSNRATNFSRSLPGAARTGSARRGLANQRQIACRQEDPSGARGLSALVILRGERGDEASALRAPAGRGRSRPQTQPFRAGVLSPRVGVEPQTRCRGRVLRSRPRPIRHAS